LYSQDLIKFQTADPLSANGQIQMNDIFYFSNRKNPPRQMQNWLLYGNLNFKIFDIINAPFSFNYSNQGNQFTQPNFNQSSFHPNYKWITLHVGTISQSWSAYTVNGHVFKGAVLELTPGRWNFVLLHGQFQKAIAPLPNSPLNTTASYKRMGTGIKLGFSGNKSSISAHFFAAADDINSIKTADYQTLAPASNQCAGMQFQHQLFSRFRITGDIGISKMNIDSRFKYSEANYNALKFSGILNIKPGTISINYENVDPGYRTLGAYYFNNDLENITAGFQIKLFKTKCTINANIGKQHDNLDKKKRSEMTRTVSNFSGQLQLSKRLNFNASYSNFLSYTNLRPFTDYLNNSNPYIGWDTLNFRQISENTQLGLMWNVYKDTLQALYFNSNATVQRSVDQQGENRNSGNLFYNLSGSIAYTKAKTGTTLSAAFNAAQTASNGINIRNFSPVFSYSQSLLKKQIVLSFSAGNTFSAVNQKNSAGVFNARMNMRYTYHKKHNFSFNCTYLRKSDAGFGNSSNLLNEFTMFLTYSVGGELFKVERSKKPKP
jgi:hypothetical protein